MMKRLALASAAAAFVSVASAQQEADPALDSLSPPGPSELDALSQGEQTDFPDIGRESERKPVSVTLRALNKVTAKYTDIVINMGETAKFGALEITPRYCDKRPPEEFPETTAFVEIMDTSRKLESDLKVALKKPEAAMPPRVEAGSTVDAATVQVAAGETTSGERKLPENMIFSGWMFASSPALNGVEHAVYDVWVIDCKTVNVES